jgi:hypothetical protein
MLGDVDLHQANCDLQDIILQSKAREPVPEFTSAFVDLFARVFEELTATFESDRHVDR